MNIRRAYQIETNSLLHMTINTMSESSMGTVKNDFQIGMNMFVPLLTSGAYYLVAIDQNKMAGWVLLGPDFNPLNTWKTGSILSLYVLPPYRNVGLGKKLMLKALEELKFEGYQSVQLNVFKGNPAKDLYEKLGFQEISFIMEKEIN